MFERFTDRARRVIVLAQEEARTLQHLSLIHIYDVSRAGQPIDLSPTEYKLLRYLMDNEGRVLSKAQILDHVWQYDWGGDAAIVESYISYLRKKVDGIVIEDENGDKHKVTPLIETKRGIGYMIRAPKN